MRKTIPFTLMILSSLLSYAYQVTVTGIVIGPGGNGVPDIQVLIYSRPNDHFAIDTMVRTDETGHFEAVVEVGDDLNMGVLYVMPSGCGVRHQKRINFDRDHVQHRVKLRACKNECRAEIKIQRAQSGEITLEAVAPSDKDIYTYLWSNGDTTKQIMITELSSYCVEITDSVHCRARGCVDLSDSSCSVEVVTHHATSNIQQDFTLLHAKVRGHAPFSYTWSTGATDKNIRVIDTGEYCVSIVDALGCKSDACDVVKHRSNCKTRIEVVQTDTPNLSSVSLVALSSGLAPLRYLWNTGDTTQRIAMMNPGVYCVTVVDAGGCKSRDCFQMDTDVGCAVDIRVKPIANISDGRVSLMAAAKGQGPLNFLWNTGDTSRTIIPDSSLEYCVEILDLVGCMAMDCINLDHLRDSCHVEIRANPHGLLTAVSRGVSVASYRWSSGETTRHIRPQEPGEYCVTATSIFGCEVRSCFTVNNIVDARCQVKIRHRHIGDGRVTLQAAVADDAHYNFDWDTGDSTKLVVVDSSGEYCVTAYSNHCKATACISLKLGRNGLLIGDPGGRFGWEVEGAQMELTPNPFADQVTLGLDLTEGGTTMIEIFGLDGRSVYRKGFNLKKGFNKIGLDLEYIDPGLYLLQMIHKRSLKTIKIIKS